MSEKHLGIDVGRIDSTQKNELGFEILKSDGRRYRYVQASGAIALGDVLMADYTIGTLLWGVKTVSAADLPCVGCWPNENPAGGQTARVAVTTLFFFWMLVKGDANVKAAAAVVVGAPAIPTAVAGTVDDTAASAANALAQAAGVPMIFTTVSAAGFARVMFG